MSRNFGTHNEDWLIGGIEKTPPGTPPIPESSLSRTVEEGLQEELRLLADRIAGMGDVMRAKIIGDLIVAQNQGGVYSDEMAQEARARLTRASIPQNLSKESLGVLEKSIPEGRLAAAASQAFGPKKNKAFDDLFRKDSSSKVVH